MPILPATLLRCHAPLGHRGRRQRRQLWQWGAGCLCAALWPLPSAAAATLPGQEPRQRLAPGQGLPPQVAALTLDACGGAYDQALIQTLIRLQVPATLFVTARWLRANPEGLQQLLAHPGLFELENHGAEHRPALVGQTLYGMHGPAELVGVEREIAGGAAAIQASGRPAPRWYRGAGARYDDASLGLINRLGLQVAGYSLNADDGASASAQTVAARLRRVQAGDIILAHMNKPAGGTAEGVADALPALLKDGWQFVRLSQGSGRPLAVAPMAHGPGPTARAAAHNAVDRVPAGAPPQQTPSR